MSVINSIFNLLRFNQKNWKAVVLCIFAATVFWFFNALNKNYTTNISFPLTFDYHTENYVAVRPLPEEIRINVTGIGWDLFRRSLGVKVPALVIPLERPSEIDKIVGSTLPALFANQLERIQINFVLTDTLHIALEPKATRWVSLKLDSPSILFRKGYAMVSEATISPDSVYIEGPWPLIKSLSEPVYLKLVERNIDHNFQEDVEIKFLNDELISRTPGRVNVSFSVDPMIDVQDSIQLHLTHVPVAARPAIGNQKVFGVFSVAKSHRDAFHADSIRAVVSLKNFSRGRKKVLPEFSGLPPYTQVLHVDSVLIKF
jgi:hypothetical protein